MQTTAQFTFGVVFSGKSLIEGLVEGYTTVIVVVVVFFLGPSPSTTLMLIFRYDVVMSVCLGVLEAFYVMLCWVARKSGRTVPFMGGHGGRGVGRGWWDVRAQQLRWYGAETAPSMSRKTAKARVFVRFLCAGFNLEGNRGNDREEMSDAPSSGTASGLLAHNVAGIHVFMRNGGMVADPRQDNEIKLIETRLYDKAERIVQVILGAQIRVAILVDTHMSAEEMRLFNLHL